MYETNYWLKTTGVHATVLTVETEMKFWYRGRY